MTRSARRRPDSSLTSPEVDFLASVGMRVLVAAQEAADAMSVRFGIVADGPATSRPIRLLGIDAILALYPTLDDAVRDLR